MGTEKPRLSRTARLFIALGVMSLTAVMLGVLVVAGIFYEYSRDLPDLNKLANYEPPIVTRFYSDDGKLLAEYATEHRIYVPLQAMPKRVIDAFIAAEDKNFYTHPGVDFMSIVRAALTNINNYGENKSLVGGSTITQQVVKNFLLTNERSLERKIKEAILAFRISKIYDKNRILELYLNQIFLGNRSYGVASAALNYFNKPLEELTIEEAAFLAGLPKAPSSYHPARNYQRAVARRDYVLGEMLDNNFINEDDYAKAKATPIMLRAREASEIAKAPFFAEEVRRHLAKMYGEEALYEGGLFVKTTVKPEFQAYADKALRKALTEYDRRHGYHGPVAKLKSMDGWREELQKLRATTPVYEDQQLAVVENTSGDAAGILTESGEKGVIPLAEMKWARRFISETAMGPAVGKPSDVLALLDVVLVAPVKDEKDKPVGNQYRLLQIPKVNGGLIVMDPHTGKVLAMSGGYSMINTQFNRATQAKRQPGSAFKPFVYLAALENGFTPASVVVDGPVSLPQGPGLPNWEPKNYTDDFLGPTTLRRGLEKSRNLMTVQLAYRMGIDKVIDIGKRFGIYKDMPRQFSAVLGSVETTVMDLANAYAMVVNGGKRVSPQLIERIDDRYGKTIFRRDERACEQCSVEGVTDSVSNLTPPVLQDNRETVIDEATAYQLTYILEGVVQRGTAVRAKSLGIPLGGKTGTTNESRDTWFMGFTPDLVVGLYVGYDQPRSLGKKETGSTVALPGFIEFVSHAMEGKPSRPFAMPKGIKLYKIDMYTGQPAYPGAGGVILEAFKASEEPGMDNYGIAGQGQGLYGGYDYYTNEQQMGQGALPWQSNPQPDTGPEYTTGSGAGYPPPTRYQGYRAGSQAHISVNPAPPGGVSAPAPVATPEPVDNGWQVSPVQQRQPRMRFRGPEAAEQSGSGQSGTGGLY